MSLFGEIRKSICEQLGVNPREVRPETSIASDLKADFIDSVELIMALEAKFNIEIPDEDTDQMKTIDDAVSYIESKLDQAPRAKEE